MDGAEGPHSLGLLVGRLGGLDKGLEGVGVGLSDHDDVAVEVEGEGSFSAVVALLELVLTHHLLGLLVSLGFLLLLELTGLQLLDLPVPHGVDHVDLLVDLLVLGKSNLDNFIHFIDFVGLGSVPVKVNARKPILRL